MENLFVYGTLLNPRIRDRVFGQSLSGFRDALPGFRKVERMVGDTYPGLLPSEDSSAVVEGIRFSMPGDILRRVDSYEGSLYFRKTLDLRSGAEAWVYFPAENRKP